MKWILSWCWLALIISSALATVIAIATAISAPTIKSLEDDLEAATQKNNLIQDNVRNLFDGFLYHLWGQLGFNHENGNNERISLYIHDLDSSSFVPCGRYSPNPTYKKSGRPEYPDSEGCIAHAWKNGWHYVELDTDKRNRNDQHQAQYQVPKRTSGRFKMPTTTYACLRIVKAGSGEPLAVVVVESAVVGRIAESDLKDKLTSQHNYLSQLICNLYDYIPMPSNAANSGF